MPIYFFWGNDDFALTRAVAELRQSVLDPAWSSFNYERLPGDRPDALSQALTQVMTPPFGTGGRLVWLENTTIGQQCSAAMLAEFERTLPTIAESNILLLSASQKPDGRLKSTKLLQQHAQIREFSAIAPWQTEALLTKTRQVAQELQVPLTPAALEQLAVDLGSNTRQLYSELEKLGLYAASLRRPLELSDLVALVSGVSHGIGQLATALRQGDTPTALTRWHELAGRNEPALRIVFSLVGYFRTWLGVKLMVESGEKDDRAIARNAGVSNPKRVYFLKQEVRGLSSRQLQQALGLLLDLEFDLKRGAEETSTMQAAVIALCHACQPVGGDRRPRSPR